MVVWLAVGLTGDDGSTLGVFSTEKDADMYIENHKRVNDGSIFGYKYYESVEYLVDEKKVSSNG